MKLKLAKYSEDGKFEKFLECGREFVYAGNVILTLIKFDRPDGRFGLGRNEKGDLLLPVNLASEVDDFNEDSLLEIIISSLAESEDEGSRDYSDAQVWEKDEKDPLNRFDGLFDGRTYGGGRIVLMRCAHKTIRKEIWQDDVILGDGKRVVTQNHATTTLLSRIQKQKYSEFKVDGKASMRIIGNLHQNPELFKTL